MKVIIICLIVVLNPLDALANLPGFSHGSSDRCGHYGFRESVSTRAGLNPFSAMIHVKESNRTEGCLATIIHPKALLTTCNPGKKSTVRLMASNAALIRVKRFMNVTSPDEANGKRLIFLVELEEPIMFNLNPKSSIVNQLCLPRMDQQLLPAWTQTLYTFSVADKIPLRLSHCNTEEELICAAQTQSHLVSLEEGTPLMVVRSFRLTLMGFYTTLCAGGKTCEDDKLHFIPLTNENVKSINKNLISLSG